MNVNGGERQKRRRERERLMSGSKRMGDFLPREKDVF